MQQRAFDQALVSKIIREDGSRDHPKGAVQMLIDGLPLALPVPVTVADGANAAAHRFQIRFLGHLESCLAGAKRHAESDKAAAEAQIEEAVVKLSAGHAAANQASAALDEAIAQVVAKNARVEELEAALRKAEGNHSKWEANGSKQQTEWAKLRQLHEVSKAVDEGALRMLEGGEGDADARSAAVAAVTNFIAEQRAEETLQSAAPLALAAKPSARGTFDRVTAEAVVKLVQGRTVELCGKLDSIAPEERHLRAEIVGLWAISDCARDNLSAAQQEDAKALVARIDCKSAREEDLQRVQEQEKALQSQEAAKASAIARVQQVVDAEAALGRLAQPEADKADKVGEPEAKRQRLNDATP